MGKLLRCRGTVPVGSFASFANRAKDAAPGAIASGNRDRRSWLLRVEHAIGQRLGINLRADLLVAVWFLPS